MIFKFKSNAKHSMKIFLVFFICLNVSELFKISNISERIVFDEKIQIIPFGEHSEI